MFGYCNELCGENGFRWTRRVMMLHPTLSDPQSEESARAFASYMGGKYGYSQAVAEAAPQRVAQILQLLGTRLAQQQAKGRKFFIGERLSALDIYWATFAALIKPLPPELCPIPEPLRAFFTNTNPVVAPPRHPPCWSTATLSTANIWNCRWICSAESLFHSTITENESQRGETPCKHVMETLKSRSQTR